MPRYPSQHFETDREVGEDKTRQGEVENDRRNESLDDIHGFEEIYDAKGHEGECAA